MLEALVCLAGRTVPEESILSRVMLLKLESLFRDQVYEC